MHTYGQRKTGSFSFDYQAVNNVVGVGHEEVCGAGLIQSSVGTQSDRCCSNGSGRRGDNCDTGKEATEAQANSRCWRRDGEGGGWRRRAAEDFPVDVVDVEVESLERKQRQLAMGQKSRSRGWRGWGESILPRVKIKVGFLG